MTVADRIAVALRATQDERNRVRDAVTSGTGRLATRPSGRRPIVELDPEPLGVHPSIRVDGDRATAQSRGAYVAPDLSTKTAQMVFFVTYEDTLVRREGRWIFQQRVVKGGIPPAPAK